jgi:hypothetical protein
LGARFTVVGLIVTPVTEVVTVTTLVAVWLPSTVVTVIVAVPFAMAVTTPEDETVATPVLLLVYVTFWFEAVEGDIVGVTVPVAPPTFNASVDGANVTPVTGVVTVIVLVAV